jgi:hypothetical protein
MSVNPSLALNSFRVIVSPEFIGTPFNFMEAIDVPAATSEKETKNS